MKTHQKFDSNVKGASGQSQATTFAISSLQDSGRLFTTLLFMVIVGCMLVAVIAGTNAYKSLYDIRSATDTLRSSQNLVVNSIRANDVTDGIAAATGPEGKALVLLEDAGSDQYETRIYLYQGAIVQEYALAGSPYTPERASKLAHSSTFDFTYSKGMLTVSTDQGQAHIALRSVRGGA